tara:strand:+ start:705 stop:827 length:123 start_codon:yes stop_codon:yes gene_type:complete
MDIVSFKSQVQNKNISFTKTGGRKIKSAPLLFNVKCFQIF